jgi:4-nitrophenyl phosphatase
VAWILDLDGVVWRGDSPIAGSADAVAALRGRGDDVRFLTNNSSMTLEQYVVKLRAAGVEAEPDELLTSAQAAATLILPGETVLVCGGPGVVEAVESRGGHAVRDGERGDDRIDAVVVGWHRDFDFDRMAAASNAIRQGARFVATNTDATFPVAGGLLPGNGAIVASVRVASGVDPVVAGKPNEAMAALVRERLGADALRTSTLVGDRPDTDGLMARRLGARFALVLSGVATQADADALDPPADAVAVDLAALVAE